MSKKSTVVAKTGHPAPVSGQYRPSGGKTEYTLSKDDITPPNRHGKRQEFVLVDQTQHKKR